MSLYHISYDAKDSTDSEALRLQIPLALLRGSVGVTEMSEPTRSTLRFVADGDDNNRKRIFSIVSGFSDRCYYFITCADEFLQDGKTYFKGKTMANEALDSNFKTILAAALNTDDSNGGKI